MGFILVTQKETWEWVALALAQQLDTMKAGISVIFLVFSWCEMAIAAVGIMFKAVRNKGWGHSCHNYPFIRVLYSQHRSKSDPLKSFDILLFKPF